MVSIVKYDKETRRKTCINNLKEQVHVIEKDGGKFGENLESGYQFKSRESSCCFYCQKKVM